MSHATVKTAYDRWKDGEALRSDVRQGFEYGGVVFEEYRGSLSGVDFIHADQARFVPVGVPGASQMYYAPADFVETVNTIGLPIYAKQERMKFDRGVDLHTQSNSLPIFAYPKALYKATKI